MGTCDFTDLLQSTLVCAVYSKQTFTAHMHFCLAWRLLLRTEYLLHHLKNLAVNGRRGRHNTLVIG